MQSRLPDGIQVKEAARYTVNKLRYLSLETDCQLSDGFIKDEVGDSDCLTYRIDSGTNNLCALCANMFSETCFQHLAKTNNFFQHHHPLQLRECVNQGCLFCKTLEPHIKLRDWHESSYPVIFSRIIDQNCSMLIVQSGTGNNSYKERLTLRMFSPSGKRLYFITILLLGF